MTSWSQPRRNFFRVAIAVALFVPGLILGILFKGAAYLSPTVRTSHNMAAFHFEPMDTHSIGSPDKRVNLEEIKKALIKLENYNHFHKTINNLIVYATRGTEFNHDPGLCHFKPKKIILHGAAIVHKPCAVERLDAALVATGKWEKFCNLSEKEKKTSLNLAQVAQYKVVSEKAALDDTPPKISLFSAQRFNRVYVVG